MGISCMSVHSKNGLNLLSVNAVLRVSATVFWSAAAEVPGSSEAAVTTTFDDTNVQIVSTLSSSGLGKHSGFVNRSENKW